MPASVNVKGLREVDRALGKVEKETRKVVRRELKGAGEIVARDARSRFSPIDARSAASFRSRVKSGLRVVVEQRRGKTTGQHPEFGAMQMRKALVPAAADNEDEVVEALEDVLDNLARRAGF